MKNTMKLSSLILALFSLQGLSAAVAQTETSENSVQFTVASPIGRAIVKKSGKNKFYLGYFCLEMGKDSSQKDVCIKTQFGRGLDLRLGVDFMGNKTGEAGTWGPVGPVFDKKTGDEFYINALSAKNADDFQDIWSAVWNQEGYNWAEHPVEVKFSKIEKFIELLTEKSKSVLSNEELRVCVVRSYADGKIRLGMVNQYGGEGDFILADDLPAVMLKIAQEVKAGRCNQSNKLLATCEKIAVLSYQNETMLKMTVGTEVFITVMRSEALNAIIKTLVQLGSCKVK